MAQGGLKKVSNRKRWTEHGWLYEMRRICGGESFGYNVVINKYQMHQRDLVARELWDARKAFSDYIDRKLLDDL